MFYQYQLDIDNTISFLDENIELTHSKGMSVCFTGPCSIGSRSEVQAMAENNGMSVTNSVTKDLDYLVVGSYSNRIWTDKNHSRKISYALSLREAGHEIRVISEEQWIELISQ